ncbi:MAG TPA: T9SS type A sorting domain-containing protein [Bacteroidia bacterium]|nr:T9SS type A sorting domain-containing protein [Bacteroidia bacterium]
MKKIFTLIISCVSVSALAQNPIDTSGGRYWAEIFPSVTIDNAVNYGSNVDVSGNTQTLRLDVYEPAGDTVQYRPLLVLAHGGSFIGGTKTDQDVVEMCTRFAKMGYVCASINYRLGLGFPIDSTHAGRAVIRAVQDMKAAVRFFRKDFTLGNTYKIHPDYIFAGGSSAGAFMALHLAYMDSTEVPAYLNIGNLGGIEGASGNPGYPSNVLAVINLCGALGDSAWIQPGDVAFVSMHGNVDQTVPYGSTTIYVLGIPLLVIDGSATLHTRANNIGVNNPFHTWWGADHVPYYGTGPVEIAYMDSTIDFVKAFLRPYFGLPLSIDENQAANFASVYPNPVGELLTLQINTTKFSNQEVALMDATGRIAARFNMNAPSQSFDVSGFAKGIYAIRLTIDQKTIIKKLIID